VAVLSATVNATIFLPKIYMCMKYPELRRRKPTSTTPAPSSKTHSNRVSSPVLYKKTSNVWFSKLQIVLYHGFVRPLIKSWVNGIDSILSQKWLTSLNNNVCVLFIAAWYISKWTAIVLNRNNYYGFHIKNLALFPNYVIFGIFFSNKQKNETLVFREDEIITYTIFFNIVAWYKW
jgi:hypothetical protein